MNPHRFYPAAPDETVVFGAERPGYPGRGLGDGPVRAWIDYMQTRGIAGVLCLLPSGELSDYYTGDLLAAYRAAFGAARVAWTPVENYHLCPAGRLQAEILPFLRESAAGGLPAVVHCSGGLGRTGHILAAWLAHGRGFSPDAALAAVTALHRDPFEAIRYRNATREELELLLSIQPDSPQRSKTDRP